MSAKNEKILSTEFVENRQFFRFLNKTLMEASPGKCGNLNFSYEFELLLLKDVDISRNMKNFYQQILSWINTLTTSIAIKMKNISQY